MLGRESRCPALDLAAILLCESAGAWRHLADVTTLLAPNAVFVVADDPVALLDLS